MKQRQFISDSDGTYPALVALDGSSIEETYHSWQGSNHLAQVGSDPSQPIPRSGSVGRKCR